MAGAKEKKVKHYLWQTPQPKSKRQHQLKVKTNLKHKPLVVVVHRCKIPQPKERKEPTHKNNTPPKKDAAKKRYAASPPKALAKNQVAPKKN
jgi:hypothetical protein